jgi:hypothetical protein
MKEKEEAVDLEPATTNENDVFRTKRRNPCRKEKKTMMINKLFF